MNYYIQIAGACHGPYSSEQITQMQSQGQLPPSTVWAPEGSTQWKPITAFNGDAATPPPPTQNAAPALTALPAPPPIPPTPAVSTASSGLGIGAIVGGLVGAGAIAAAVIFMVLPALEDGADEPTEFAANEPEDTDPYLPEPPEQNPPPTTKSPQPSAPSSNPAMQMGNFASNRPNTANRVGVRAGFKPPNLRKGKDHEYHCGQPYGQVRIRTYGTYMPQVQQQYFAAKGVFMIQQFRRITGFAPPKGFYYSICFFSDKGEYREAASHVVGSGRVPPAFCQPTGTLISPIMVSSTGEGHTTDIVTHEMVHAIAIASYGDFPQCFDEGVADWLADSYRHRKANPGNFYYNANVKFLAEGIRKGGFPSLDKYLACESYSDWDDLLPDRGVGYCIGSMLLDYLWNNQRQFLLASLAHCRQHTNNIPARSKAFRTYVGQNWRGGWADIDRKFQAWILDRAKYNWQPDK